MKRGNLEFHMHTKRPSCEDEGRHWGDALRTTEYQKLPEIYQGRGME